MLDAFDRAKYAAVYRLLAEVLQRERTPDPPEGHMSYLLGDLTRRVFVGAAYTPPDELLELTARALRTGDPAERQHLARRLLEHAQLLVPEAERS
jgi:hypothetical protein